MTRVQTLTDNEYEVLKAIRKLAQEAQVAHTASATGDIRRELEDIYYDLENMRSSEWEEVVGELKRRIYAMLR